MGEALRGVRASVTEAGMKHWATLIAAIGPGAPLEVGSRIMLGGLDPTHQGPHDSGRAILHRLGHTRVFVPMDMDWAQRVGHLREVQTLLGFPREERWEAIATVVSAQSSPESEVVVKLGPILVNGQLVLDEGGRVPGLDEAMKVLDRLQAHIAVPNSAPTPETLLPLLFKILETHHWRAFRELYDQAATLSDKKVAFDQFSHAWEVASGAIAFEGYVEPKELVGEAPEGTIVRTRLAREGEKGESLHRPIKWVKRGAGWRLAGGLL
jgi:hypothetical protein